MPPRRALWLAAVLLPLLGAPWIARREEAPPAPVRFTDVTEGAGLRFRHVHGGSGQKFMPETVGSGGAFFDFDDDGWLDIFLVNSGPLLGFQASGRILPALYRNNRDGTFADVTAGSGLDMERYGMGCAVGDYDGDGLEDLYVTAVLGPSRLFRNRGGGKFEDVTARAGVDNRGRWGTSAAWLDYDNDGLLDLFVCNYVRYTIDDDRYFRNPLTGQSYGLPQFFEPDSSALYRNRGNGTFEDVSRAARIDRPGKALGVCPCDVDDDGFVDLFIANDTVPNYLYHNLGNGTFRQVGAPAGIATDDTAKARAGMGIDYADYRNDGSLAFLIGTFSEQDNYFFVRTGRLLFEDQAHQAGLTSRPDVLLAFGLVFFDCDNDGWRDVFIANGHVLDDIREVRPQIGFGQTNQLYHNRRDGTFVDVSASSGAPFQYERVSRGCAYGDYDNDGDLDLLVTNNNGPAELLRNDGGRASHWLQVSLVGAEANRGGLGAEIRVTAAGVTQRDWLRSGGSYLSQNMRRVHFGLGDAPRVERLEVRWPGGKTERFNDPPADRWITIVEGRGIRPERVAPGPSSAVKAALGEGMDP